MKRSRKFSEERKESLLDRLIKSGETPSLSPQLSSDIYNEVTMQDFSSFIDNHRSFSHENSSTTETEEEVEIEAWRVVEKEETVTATSIIKCEYCDMLFTKRNNYSRHINSHTHLKQYECRFCRKTYHRKDQWESHVMGHMKTGIGFDCPVSRCVMQFNHLFELQSHLDESHDISPNFLAECKRCWRHFGKSNRLLVHFYTNHEETIPHKDIRMSKIKSEPVDPDLDFDIQSKPKKIKKTHGFVKVIKEEIIEEDEKNREIPKTLWKKIVKCEICNNNFSNASNLARHRRIHARDSLNEENVESSESLVDLKTVHNLSTDSQLLLNDLVTKVDGNKEKETSPVDELHPKQLKNDSIASEIPLNVSGPIYIETEQFQADQEDDYTSDDQSDLTTETPDELTILNDSEKDPTNLIYPALPVTIPSIETELDCPPILEKFTEEPHFPDKLAEATKKEVKQGNSANSDFKCIPCGLTFEDTTMFVIHRILHTKDDQFKCGLCGLELNDKYQFNLHMIYSQHI